MKITYAFIVSIAFLPEKSHSENAGLYSVNALSFVYHAYTPNRNFNQYFNNKLFFIEKQFNEQSQYSFVAGTLINSESNRCALLGVGDTLWKRGKWSFEGMYMYAGEFFFGAFSHCGDAGAYHNLKKITGIGFAPYIYYGGKYEFNQYVKFKTGVLLPGIIVLNFQFRF